MLEEQAQEALKDADLLCLSGSLIAGAPADGYRRLTELAHRAGVPVAVDSHGEYLSCAIDAAPELIKVNAEEAGAALGAAPPDDGLLSWSADAARRFALAREQEARASSPRASTGWRSRTPAATSSTVVSGTSGGFPSAAATLRSLR